MARRFEIVLSRRGATGSAATGAPLTAWGRVKLILTGSLLAVVFLAILTAAVILGSILAVVLLVVFALAVVVAIVRSAVRRRPPDPPVRVQRE